MDEKMRKPKGKAAPLDDKAMDEKIRDLLSGGGNKEMTETTKKMLEKHSGKPQPQGQGVVGGLGAGAHPGNYSQQQEGGSAYSQEQIAAQMQARLAQTYQQQAAAAAAAGNGMA